MELNFVFIKDEINISNFHLKKNEVGIIAKDLGEYYLVNFSDSSYPLKIQKEKLVKFNPLKTGDSYDKKICNVCNRLLPVENFAKNQNGKNNRTVRRPSCNECRVLIDGASIPPKLKREWEKRKPNFEIWECPICKKRTIPGITSKVVLDHNHHTGQPRAWICDSCNTGLGRFKDDINLLQSAIDYLKKSE